MTHPQLLQSLLLLGVLGSCVLALNRSHPATDLPADPFAVRKIRHENDWQLSVYGDGSGTLSHRQYPGYHLDYPLQTFDFRHADTLLLYQALSDMATAVDDKRSAVSCRMLRRELAWQPIH